MNIVKAPNKMQDAPAVSERNPLGTPSRSSSDAHVPPFGAATASNGTRTAIAGVSSKS